MGWAVKCKGADLIEGLRASEDKLFGRKYALYIIALATEIDDDAIKWLSEYGRAIDSLTGETIAFIVFYNTVRFYATSRGLKAESMVDIEGTKRIFRRSLHTVEVAPKALNGSWKLTEHVKGRISFPDEAFVTSMTYESDNLARHLGIKPTELPCFVIIDDPNSKKYYLLSMTGFGKEIIKKLREFVGEFYHASANKEYLALIKSWDTLQISLIEYQKLMPTVEEEIAQRVREFPDNPLNLCNLMKDIDLVSGLKGIVAWLSKVYQVPSFGGKPKISMPNDLQREAQRLTGWIAYVDRLRRSLPQVEYFLQAFDRRRLSKEDSVKLGHLYQRKLRGLVPGAALNWEELKTTEKKNILEKIISRSNPPIVEIENRLAPLQEFINRLYLDQSERSQWRSIAQGYRYIIPLREAMKEVAELEKEIELIKQKLSRIKRPKADPILTRMKWGERRELVASKASKALKNISLHTDSVFKALEYGMRLTGLP